MVTLNSNSPVPIVISLQQQRQRFNGLQISALKRRTASL
jgi:hypothetical protein